MIPTKHLLRSIFIFLLLVTALAVRPSAADAAIENLMQHAYIKASGASYQFGNSIDLDDNTMVIGSSSNSAYVFTRIDGIWTLQTELMGSNTEAQDNFGASVAISGDTIVVGAPNEDSNATGVNGDQTNNVINNAGAAYVFTRSNGVWIQQAYMKASNPDIEDFFGSSVAISGDTIVVGAWLEDSDADGINGDAANNNTGNSGAAYVFARSGSTWTQQAYLKALNSSGDDRFAETLAISENTILVGATGELYAFTSIAGVWSQTQIQDPISGGGSFGYGIAIEGDTLVASDMGDGKAFVYTRTDTVWSLQDTLEPTYFDYNDQFGEAVAISGDTIVVGSRREASSATGVNGDETNNDMFGAGAAYVYTLTGGTWSQEAYLKSPAPNHHDYFADSVAIFGDMIAVGTPREDSNATGINGDPTNNDANDRGAVFVFGPNAPIAGNDAISVQAVNSTTTVEVLANDYNPDPLTGLTITGINNTGTSGSVTFSSSNVAYNPENNFIALAVNETATDTFHYTVTNGTGADTATVTVTINGVNDTATASNDLYHTDFETPLEISASGVLTNDTDPDTSDVLTAVKVTDPSHGGLILNTNGSFTYIPDAAYSGTDSFTYKVNDGTVDSNVATVNITVYSDHSPTPTEEPTDEPTPTDEPPAVGELEVGGNLNSGAIFPEFAWGVEPNEIADWYHIVIKDANGTTVLDYWMQASEFCQGSLCSFTPDENLLPAGLLNGAYSWYLQSWNDDGTPSGSLSGFVTGTPFNVTVPIPTAPSANPDAITSTSGHPILMLPNDPGTTWYKLWIGTTDFTSVAFWGWVEKDPARCDQTTCTIIPEAYPTNDEYVIWIQAWGPAGFNNADSSLWTELGTFTLALPAPGLVEPLTTTVSDSTVTFTWKQQPEATWYNIWLGKADFTQTVHYQWHSGLDAGCTGGICTLTLTETPLETGVAYLWYLESWGPGGLSSGGDEGGWSHSESFIP